MDFQYERQIARDYFFYNDSDEKLATINLLKSHGNHLGLLEDILDKEDTPPKSAAAKRLESSNNYAATTLLIRTLTDEETEVSLTALEALIKVGDRSLIPDIKERIAQLSTADPKSEAQYSELVNRLEFSASMQSDGHPDTK